MSLKRPFCRSVGDEDFSWKQSVSDTAQEDLEEEFPIRQSTDKWTPQMFRERICSLKNKNHKLERQNQQLRLGNLQYMGIFQEPNAVKRRNQLQRVLGALENTHNEVSALAAQTDFVRTAIKQVAEEPSNANLVDDALEEVQKMEKRLKDAKGVLEEYMVKIRN
ncbi:hypothetical protein F66182_4265 [Fusarium sp. NRRL 66182]|nr:hypothetical protein F66182_4265 [Fusarium sp. NRRL 66182]